MKKLLFFKSSSSSNKNNNQSTPPLKDAPVYCEKKKKNKATDIVDDHQTKHEKAYESNKFGIRRSISLSSETVGDRQLHLTRQSPCTSTTTASFKQPDNRSSRSCTPTTKSQSKSKWFADVAGQTLSSESSSNCSSSLSNSVLDRFIDGEQYYQHERKIPKNNYARTFVYRNGIKEKPRSHSFREPKEIQNISTQDWVDDNGHGHGSSRELAKHVIERLSQSQVMLRDNSKTVTDSNEDGDMELVKRSKEAEERAVFLSDELEQGKFLQDCKLSVPALIQINRNLKEERVNMAFEVSNVLQDRMAEKNSAKEDLQLIKTEWDSQIQRLRERVRELAEKNVLLQRQILSCSEAERQIKDLTINVEESREENRNLCQNLSQLRGKYMVVEEERNYIRKQNEEEKKECKELQKSIARLVRTCNEQEKTINGLREGLSDEFRTKNFEDNQFGKLQMEQVRLTGVEKGLRKEIESYRYEIENLRKENTNLLDRLGGDGSTFKLDQEISNRVDCCQDQGIFLISESVKLCMKLLEYIKVNQTRSSKTEDLEKLKNCLNGEFVIESDMKIKGFTRRAATLVRSLENLSVVVSEKSNLHILTQTQNESSQGKLESELKAESLLTRLLREKLYTKELDLENLEAELSAAVGANNILRSEAQNAIDTVSCMTHNMKNLELQMIKKDESINRLQNELQDCKKELSIMRGIVPKISEERDFMWKEVKNYSEKTMLLNSEIAGLKKKIEVLDEDILIKEGQITILKDSISKPFDLLASPEFLLD